MRLNAPHITKGFALFLGLECLRRSLWAKWREFLPPAMVFGYCLNRTFARLRPKIPEDWDWPVVFEFRQLPPYFHG